MRRRLLVPLLLVFMLVAGLAAINRPAQAQSSGCSAINGQTNTIDNGVNWDLGSFDFAAGETISVTAGEEFTNTPYPVTLTVGSLSQNGASVSITIPSSGNYGVSVENGYDASQVINVSCSASASGGGGGGSSGGNPSWGGYTDGRLNPDPAEYFSLWCSGNTLNVYSAVSGRGVLLAAIPLTQIQALSVGTRLAASDSAGGKMSLVRVDQDTFRLEGNNGNSAPSEGSKSFSLSLCLTLNGGPVATATRTPIPRPPNTATPSPTPSPTAIDTQPPTATATATATATSTLTPTASATNTAASTRTPRPTRTPTATRTATPTKAPAFTPSATQTASPTKPPTNTPGPSPTPTATVLLRTVMPTPTRTPPRARPSPTLMPTATITPTAVTATKWFGDLFTSQTDTDGDGTPDGHDFCKREPGPIFGCTDPDGDGLAGPWDLCPDVAGSSSRGCPDRDSDGVADAVDLCPDYTPPADQNAQGCLDTDRDGVPNIQDWCPSQVKENVSQFQGCNDPDGDGYVNGVRVPAAYVDYCPAVNGVNFDNGCPPATPLPVGGVTTTPTLSLFDLANQLGPFGGLVLTGATATPSCGRGSYGFCFGS